MNKPISTKLSIFIAFVTVLGIFSIKENIYGQTATNTVPNVNTMPNTNVTTPAWTGEEQGTISRVSVTLLLECKTLPKGEFIKRYDSTLFKIVNGHFVIKVPYNTNCQSQVDLLTGQSPNLKSSEAELVSELSTTRKLCLNHVDLVSGTNNTMTDVAIKNNSTQDVIFPPTNSVCVGVNSIAELLYEHE